MPLFVHIGDFLSIATRGQWLSPKHRVICPNLNFRYSLVYFVYPKRGVSIKLAEDLLASILDKAKEDEGLYCEELDHEECQHYSVLQNQQLSSQRSDESALDTLRQYRKIPFNEVMAVKWAQVQRTN